MIFVDKYMFVCILIITTIIIIKLSEIKSYQLIIATKYYNLKSKNSIFLSKFKTRANKSDEWQEDNSAIGNNGDLPSIHQSIYNNLDQALGAIITARAIDTASYYMLEFRDDINQKWMLSFLDYKNVGFVNGDWQLHLNEMIKLDSQQVKVYMDPPRVSSRHQPAKEEEYLKAMYIHEFEPRKIAHKLIAIREDISIELIEDFGCIALENKEAVKFANNWIISGKEYAEINRGVTRFSDGSSTPFRDKTYKEMSLMMTNVALDIIRGELNVTKDKTSLLIIESILEQITQSGEGLDQLNKMLLESSNPQRFLEEMSYCGLTQNNLKDGNSNFLKLSKSLFMYREMLAKASIQILSAQNKELRYLYKLIKDFGGFKSFDLRRKRVNVRIVNMKEEEKEEEELLKLQQLEQSSSSIGDKSNQNKATPNEAISPAAALVKDSKIDDDDDQPSIFDKVSVGPMMM